MMNNIFVRLAFLKLVIFIYLIVPVSLDAQWSILNAEADSLVVKGTGYIYNVQFDSAKKYFTEMQKQYPAHPAGYFLDAMIDWWKILIDSPNKNRYKQSFLDKIQKTIHICDSILEIKRSDINPLFFKAASIGYRGRFYVEDKSWIKAVDDGVSAYDLLIECLKIAPNNHDIMLGTGIYNYFAAAIPEKYPIVKPLMLLLPSGDKKIGELQLKSSANNARYTSVEAQTALMQIYYIFDNKPFDCLPVIENLFHSYPNNPYFKKYFARTLVRVGEWKQFEQIWREILVDCLNKKYGYTDELAREGMYYIAMALQQSNNYDMALRYYYKCDEGCRAIDKDGPSSFMSMTNLNIGKIYDKQNKRELAIKQYNKVLKMPNFRYTHSDAKKYIEKSYK